MKILLTTLTLLALAWVIHLIIWKVRLPRHQIRALLLTFGAVFVFWMIAPNRNSFPLFDFIQISLLYGSISFCYVITYSAIEGDSPTLSLMKLLAERKESGLPDKEIRAFLSHRPFVKARLAALMHSGLIRKENDRYVIKGQPSIPFRIILGFRKLYGPISKGG